MATYGCITREDVENLGHRGEVVRVRSGFGRNYLLPQGLAIEATTGNKRLIDEQRRILVKRESRERITAQDEAQKLEGLELRFDRRVGEHGLLYGSVTALDIAEALKAKGITIERRKIGLRDHIKEVGDYDVVIKFHREVAPTIKVKVRKEGAQDKLESAAESAPSADAASPAAPVEPPPTVAEDEAVEA
jgi:large subunit ribosomal protein L9